MKCLALISLLFAAPAVAQTAPGTTIGLTDAQKAAILAGNTEQSVDDARAGLPSSGKARTIHGEIGAEIGTHGSRGIYGAAAIPLGDNATAYVAAESEHWDDGRHK